MLSQHKDGESGATQTPWYGAAALTLEECLEQRLSVNDNTVHS